MQRNRDANMKNNKKNSQILSHVNKYSRSLHDINHILASNVRFNVMILIIDPNHTWDNYDRLRGYRVINAKTIVSFSRIEFIEKIL